MDLLGILAGAGDRNGCGVVAVTQPEQRIRRQLARDPRKKPFRKTRRTLTEVAVRLEALDKMVRDQSRVVGQLQATLAVIANSDVSPEVKQIAYRALDRSYGPYDD